MCLGDRKSFISLDGRIKTMNPESHAKAFGVHVNYWSLLPYNNGKRMMMASDYFLIIFPTMLFM